MTIRTPNHQKHNQFLRNRKEKEIYLGINTSINCLDDWCPQGEDKIFLHKIGLYLGKIIFVKNKDGNLVPKYIPSSLKNLDEEVEKLNPLWLDEINKGYVPPRVRHDKMMGNYVELFPFNVKLLCKKRENNITLTKEQIISYFTELHKLNTTFIKNYINSINQAQSIKAYHLHDEIYDDLLDKGILQEDMFEWFTNGKKFAYSQAKLLTLDYLKKTGRVNSAIAYHDELFYAYFVWSLREFTILYYQGYIAERNNILFNPTAYIDDRQFERNESLEEVRKASMKFVLDTSMPEVVARAFVSEMDFCRLAYGRYDLIGAFYIEPLNYLPNDEVGRYSDLTPDRTPFQSPNRVYRTYPKTGKPILNDKEPPIYAPSPLGHYYFEFASNLGIFIEYYPRIYPSIKNPPKGWSKEMMKKLELTLE